MIQHLKKAKRCIVLSSELKKNLQHIVFTGCCGGVRMCTRRCYLFYVSIVHTDKNVHFEIAKPAVWPPPEPHTRSCRGSKSKAGSLPPGLSGRANSQTEDTPPVCFRQRCDSTTNEKNSQMKANSPQAPSHSSGWRFQTPVKYSDVHHTSVCVHLRVSVYSLTESTSLEECRGGGSSSDSSEDSGFRFFFFPILMTIFLWGGKNTHNVNAMRQKGPEQ